MSTVLYAESQRATLVTAGQGAPLNALGNRVTQKLTLAETGGAHYVFEVETPPGVGVPPHVHQHEDEVIYVLEGCLSLFLDGRSYRAERGDTIYFPRYKAHGFQNIGETVARTLWTVIPGSRFEQFFIELDALPAGPPDLARVAAIFDRFDITLI